MTPPRHLPRRLALIGGLALLAACDTRRQITEDGSFDLLVLLGDKPEYRRFLNAITLSGLGERFGRRQGAVTLFVPVNQALDTLPADVRALLDSPPGSPSAEQRARAAALVNANAAFGLLRLRDIQARRGQVVTWDRGQLQINQTGPRTATVVREGAPPTPGRPTIAITRGDILAADGVMHLTSSPILPGA